MLTPFLLGIHGLKNSGKDTLAHHITSAFGGVENSLEFALATPVKRMLNVLQIYREETFNNRATKEVQRRLMQTLGTDWGRDMISHEIWIDDLHARRVQTLRELTDLELPLPKIHIVTDVRFENEAAYIRSHGGRVVHIQTRPGFTNDGHPSEQGLAVDPHDWVVPNLGSQLEFFKTAEAFAKKVQAAQRLHAHMSGADSPGVRH